MSFTALSWSRKQTVRGSAKAVLLVLADHADNERQECWPSYTTLVRESGLARSTVQRGLDELEALGLVTRTARFHESGGQTSTLYRLSVYPLPAAGKPLTSQDSPPLPAIGNKASDLSAKESSSEATRSKSFEIAASASKPSAIARRERLGTEESVPEPARTPTVTARPVPAAPTHHAGPPQARPQPVSPVIAMGGRTGSYIRVT